MKSKDDCVIIFDWDDTLLPTTYITQHVLRAAAGAGQQPQQALSVDSSCYAALKEHAHVIGFMLRTARKLAHVAIVSNSLSPWIVYSGKQFLPELGIDTLLKELEIPVYYSRRHLEEFHVNYKEERYMIELDKQPGSKFGADVLKNEGESVTISNVKDHGMFAEWNKTHPDRQVLPGDIMLEVNGHCKDIMEHCRELGILKILVSRMNPDVDVLVECKKKDMKHYLTSLYPSKPWTQQQLNVISIGDSYQEQTALQEVLKESAGGSLCKTVNFLDKPNVEQLTAELRVVLVWLHRMVSNRTSFNLAMDELDDLECDMLKRRDD